jgi:acyl carrier protein
MPDTAVLTETASTDAIRALVGRHAPVDTSRLGDDDDLYDAGLSSLASVNLMLALEDAYDVEFPERMLRRTTFASVAAIRAAVEELLGRRR